MSELEKAYAYCETVTKKHAKSFYFAAKFLPGHKRKTVYPIYALCRLIDDEIDETGEENQREAIKAVEKWKVRLVNIYSGAAKNEKTEFEITDNQNFVLSAWQDLLKTYKIPQNLPLELMQGVLMDTRVKRYKTFDELYVYCYRVASTVGLMSSEILGYSDKKALEYAEAMGIGMQLTNILRDLKEDAAIGRIYLPKEDLQKFGVAENQIFSGEMNENFIELMKFQIERARNFYRKGEKGIEFLEKDSRFTVLLASRIYGKILEKMEKQNYDVFKFRAHTTKRQKLYSLPQIWFEAKNL